MIFFSILAPVIISSAHGVLSHQLNRERAALSLGASQSQVFWHVILPTALPHIITGIRIGLGVGWSTLVAAELVAADRGIGFMAIGSTVLNYRYGDSGHYCDCDCRS